MFTCSHSYDEGNFAYLNRIEFVSEAAKIDLGKRLKTPYAQDSDYELDSEEWVESLRGEIPAFVTMEMIDRPLQRPADVDFELAQIDAEMRQSLQSLLN